MPLRRLARRTRIATAWLWASLVAVGLPPASASAAGGAPADRCETAPQPKGVGVTCTLPPRAMATPLRFKAVFVGSHDDSEIALTATALDGGPLTCGEGSKTASQFEDGDVTLDCRFAAPAGATPRRLTVTMRLHHVELDRVELLAE